MKTKAEHVQFWIAQSEDDWRAVETLFAGANYIQALFFAHLVIEKLCKAIWIQYNEANVPPKIHNTIYLLSKTPIELTDERSEFLLSLNRFQLEGRYPDYVSDMRKICDKSFTRSIIQEASELREWLREKLQ